MNREQKAATIDALAADIQGAEAIFVVDYRGITVPQAAELRGKLREADAVFKIVKNSLTERAADQTGTPELKPLLEGPTALTFVRGDVALAAKAIADYARATQLLPFKGGVMNGEPLEVDQIRAISRLPSREVLYGQLVGVVASPVTGLVRTLGALVGGLAVALGQVHQKMQSGEIPSGEPPVAEAQPTAEAESQAATAEEKTGEEPPAPEQSSEEAPAEEVARAEDAAVEAPAAEQAKEKAEPDAEPAKDDNQADVSAQAESEDAETNPTKED